MGRRGGTAVKKASTCTAQVNPWSTRAFRPYSQSSTRTVVAFAATIQEEYRRIYVDNELYGLEQQFTTTPRQCCARYDHLPIHPLPSYVSEWK